MRYLYGDLTEFPQQDNVLDQLKRFVEMAVSALVLDEGIDQKHEVINENRTLLTESLRKMDGFHKSVDQAIQRAGQREGEDLVLNNMAEGCTTLLDRHVEDSKQRVTSAIKERIRQTEEQIAGLEQEILAQLKAFFVNSGLPLAGNAMQIKLYEGSYQAYSEILDVIGLRCAYRLDTSSSDFFSTPRRFSDLYGDRLDLPIGLRKAWLKKDPKVETMRVDDAFLSQVIDREDRVDIHLARKKGNGQEGVRLQIPKKNPSALGLTRIGPAGEEIPVPEELLHPSQREQVALAYAQLRPHLLELYRSRGDLAAIRIGEEDVIQKRLIPDLVKRFVTFLTPTVREIDARSPAKTELCLKVEHEGDRREEIFLQKVSMLNQLVGVPIGRRLLFAPMELHRGVPGFDKIFTEDSVAAPAPLDEPTAPD